MEVFGIGEANVALLLYLINDLCLFVNEILATTTASFTMLFFTVCQLCVGSLMRSSVCVMCVSDTCFNPLD